MKAQHKFENILLVDDDQISSIVSAAILQETKLSPKIQMVYNGKQALDFLTRECFKSREDSFCPALLFLDLNMPIMDGFEFLEAFTKDEKFRQLDISIVVLTSSAHSADQKKAFQYPIAGFITKPITPEKLQSIVFPEGV